MATAVYIPLYYIHLFCWCMQGLVPGHSLLFNMGTFLFVPRGAHGTYVSILMYIPIHGLAGSMGLSDNMV